MKSNLEAILTNRINRSKRFEKIRIVTYSICIELFAIITFLFFDKIFGIAIAVCFSLLLVITIRKQKKRFKQAEIITLKTLRHLEYFQSYFIKDLSDYLKVKIAIEYTIDFIDNTLKLERSNNQTKADYHRLIDQKIELEEYNYHFSKDIICSIMVIWGVWQVQKNLHQLPEKYLIQFNFLNKSIEVHNKMNSITVGNLIHWACDNYYEPSI